MSAPWPSPTAMIMLDRDDLASRLARDIADWESSTGDLRMGFSSARGLVEEAIRTCEKSAWQSIETAPRDGTLVLLWLATPMPLNFSDARTPVLVGYWDLAAWRDAPDCAELTPTHWMPLSAGPDSTS